MRGWSIEVEATGVLLSKGETELWITAHGMRVVMFDRDGNEQTQFIPAEVLTAAARKVNHK